MNEFLLPIIEKKPPPSIKGKYVRIKYVTQLKTAFPAFAFFCNLPQYVRDPYKRFLENQIRDAAKGYLELWETGRRELFRVV